MRAIAGLIFNFQRDVKLSGKADFLNAQGNFRFPL